VSLCNTHPLAGDSTATTRVGFDVGYPAGVVVIKKNKALTYAPAVYISGWSHRHPVLA
jgi:hypothetical protein